MEAGPGTGKTFAYLVPAILWGKRVIVSTATRTLQEQIFRKDLPLLAEVPSLGFRAAYMKGRQNYLCLRRLQRLLMQPSLEGMQGELREVLSWARVTQTGDRSELELPEGSPFWREIASQKDRCLGGGCPFLRDCFVSRMRQRAASATIVVVNHHLFMADLAVRERGAELIPRFRAVVFDEAHRIEEVATEYFGITVSNYRLKELARDAASVLGPRGRDLTRRISELSDALFGPFPLREERYRWREIPVEAIRAFGPLRNALALLREEARKGQPSEEAEAIRRRALELEEELAFVLTPQNPDYVHWCEVRGQGVFLHASPLDISKELKHRLYPRLKSAVFTSATLTVEGSFAWFRTRLGIDGGEELALPSPFNWREQAVLYIPRELPEVNSPEFIEGAVKEIERVLLLSKGRALVLFTSYRNMQEAYRALKGRLPFRTFLQGERPRERLLEEFREDTSSVLFATATFWEGVDVKGEALSCLIIDRLPFDPPTDPVIEARCERIAAEGGNPFLDYQLPMAVLALKQGMGRLIRSRSDRGLLVLLDNRALRRGYGRTFIRSLPPVEIVTTFGELQRVAGRLWDGPL